MRLSRLVVMALVAVCVVLSLALSARAQSDEAASDAAPTEGGAPAATRRPAPKKKEGPGNPADYTSYIGTNNPSAGPSAKRSAGHATKSDKPARKARSHDHAPTAATSAPTAVPRRPSKANDPEVKARHEQDARQKLREARAAKTHNAAGGKTTTGDATTQGAHAGRANGPAARRGARPVAH